MNPRRKLAWFPTLSQCVWAPSGLKMFQRNRMHSTKGCCNLGVTVPTHMYRVVMVVWNYILLTSIQKIRNLPCHLRPIFSCPSSIWQREELSKSKSTHRSVKPPWSPCTDWGYEKSSRKWNRGRNGLHQLGLPVAPSILFPGRCFRSPVCSIWAEIT